MIGEHGYGQGILLGMCQTHAVSLKSQNHGPCNLSIGAPRLVAFVRDVDHNLPRFSSLPLLPPLSQCDGASVQVIAEVLLGTNNGKVHNSCPFNQFHVILSRPLSSSPTPCLEYHGLCFLRRSFLDLEIEVCRTRSVAFLLTSAITANVETSVTTRPAEHQAENDAPIRIGKCLTM
jgi:hypothetical protein